MMNYKEISEQDLEETLASLAESGRADLTATPRTPSKSAEEGQLTIDVYQNEDEVVIQSTVAGVNNSDIDISISKDMVTVKGRRQRAEKIRQQNFFHQELYWGTFSRSVILPFDIDVDRSKASIKNGLLTIRLPKLKKGER